MSTAAFLQVSARLLRRMSPTLVGFLKAQRLFLRKDSFLVSTGFLRSCAAGRPCRQDGSPVPWMNYAVIHFLEERLQPSFSLFEYGSGTSTLFFASRVGRVVSVETDREWFEEVQRGSPDNVTLIHQACEPDADYCRIVNLGDDKCDVVVIDGQDRQRCAVNACASLTKSGVIVLDDTSRESNLAVARHLQQSGFRRIDFEGPKPGGIVWDRTSVLYKQDNCLGI